MLCQQTTTKSPSDKGPPSSTSAPFRIPRKELGYLLGRNYRGLKKLWNIEINDALNVSNVYYKIHGRNLVIMSSVFRSEIEMTLFEKELLFIRTRSFFILHFIRSFALEIHLNMVVHILNSCVHFFQLIFNFARAERQKHTKQQQQQ